jgi:hypothetical protein
MKIKLLGIGLAAVLALRVFGQSKDPVVAVSLEPSHHVRFDNGRVRVYDVQVPTEKWTLFHEHTCDNFFVFIVPTTQEFEFLDGRKGTREVKPGDVGFSSTGTGAYTHRVRAVGTLPLHVYAEWSMASITCACCSGLSTRGDAAGVPVSGRKKGVCL